MTPALLRRVRAGTTDLARERWITVVPGLAAPAVRPDVALVRVGDQQRTSRSVLLATRADAEPSPHAGAFAEALRGAAAHIVLELQRRLDGA